MQAGPATRLLGPIVLLAIAGFGMQQAVGLGLWLGPMPASGLFPLICGILLAAFAGIDLLLRLRPAPPAGEAEPPLLLRRPLLYGLGLVAFAALLRPAGFFPTSILAVVLIVRFAEGRSWRTTVLVALPASLGVWILFEHLLGVPLPHGLLAG